MKFLSDIGWLAALRRWRGPRHRGPEPADMGTAFGLDSITVVDFDSTQYPHAEGSVSSAHDWNRRLARRSRL
jgi:hypothetical protein